MGKVSKSLLPVQRGDFLFSRRYDIDNGAGVAVAATAGQQES